GRPRQRGGGGPPPRHRPRQPVSPHAPARARAAAHGAGLTVRGLALAALCLLGAAVAAAQDTAIVIQPESAGAMVQPPELARAVAEEVVHRYNAATTTRLVGRSRGAAVSGAVRVYQEPLAFRAKGDEIALVPPDLRRWFRNLGVEKSWGTQDSRSSLTLATGGTFNRVEGLPVVFGPLFDWKLHRNLRLRVDALGVFRTAGQFTDKRGDLGYIFRAELRSGEVPAYGVQFRAFDNVVPVEDWGLRNAEVGWSAFLFQRDYRDYYLSKGLAGRVFVQPERALQLEIELRHDWQQSVAARDPWTVFRNDQAWRPNPPIDDGHYTALSGNVSFDTRNDRADPTAGWWLRARIEHSHSRDVTPQAGVPAAVRTPIATDGSYAFSRLFLDFRRYMRVSPSGRVNLPLLAGGWVGGDALPLQQRLSMGGPDPLAGYGFHQ